MIIKAAVRWIIARKVQAYFSGSPSGLLDRLSPHF